MKLYLIDINVIYQIFSQNIWYILKVLIAGFLLYYWLPTKIFPQEYTGKGAQKIVFNFLYMVAYVETVVPLMIFLKIFTLLSLIFTFFLTKMIFLKFYYKKDVIEYLKDIRDRLLLIFFDYLDHPSKLYNSSVSSIKSGIIAFQQKITIYRVFQFILFFSVFFYILSILMARGLYSYSDPAPDTAQFIEWVDYLQQNQLYWDNKAFGADFFGQAISIFFVNIFTNIDPVVLFGIYPLLLLMALYIAIYYVIKDATESKYVAIFAVMIHGMIFLSPLSDYLLSTVVITTTPHIYHFLGLKFYIPDINYALTHSHHIAYIPYLRYISALAYEHASVFVFLNFYFLIKTLETKFDRYLVVYMLSLLLVFTFHGGGAIVLMPASILIAINALIFGKIDLKILKKGLAVVFIATVIGNLWMLSMIKYGVPQAVGAAAPFLDKLLHNKHNLQNIIQTGVSAVTILNIGKIQLFIALITLLALLFSYFTKRKFIYSSMILFSITIIIVYAFPNLGLPMLTRHSRLAEYIFFALTILFSFYFFYLAYKPIFFIFKKYAKYVLLGLLYLLFISFGLVVPKWVDTDHFWVNLNAIEYTSIPDIILKINRENQPFQWTVVSYVQEYSKVKNKGYHLNTQNFLMKYDPTAKYLKVPTLKIYIFVEDFPNPYKGEGEWFYRWRSDIENKLNSWIAIYSMTHKNIKLYKKTKSVTVYEIDNSNYIEHLRKIYQKKKK